MTHSEFVSIYIMAGIGTAFAVIDRSSTDRLSVASRFGLLWVMFVAIVFWPMVLTYYVVRWVGKP